MKLLLTVPMALVELIALAVTWLLAVTHKPTARVWFGFWTKILPGREWYFRK